MVNVLQSGGMGFSQEGPRHSYNGYEYTVERRKNPLGNYPIWTWRVYFEGSLVATGQTSNAVQSTSAIQSAKDWIDVNAQHMTPDPEPKPDPEPEPEPEPEDTDDDNGTTGEGEWSILGLLALVAAGVTLLG